MKAIESKLIKDRIASITDRQIFMDQFISIFQKSYRYSSITMYDYPVSKCFIDIGSEDMMELDWIRQLKDLLTLSDDEIHIHFDNGNDVNNKIDHQDEDLCFVILQKYIQFFPCCVIFNIIESVEGETIATKEVMVLPSLQAKDHSMNKMKEYIEFIERTSLYGDKENIYNKFNERMKFEIGDIEDQCGSMGLDLHFNNEKSFDNKNKIERDYQTLISGTSSNHPNSKVNVDISYLEEFCSTLSGIVQCDDDLYLITTGHGMSDKCTPLNNNYMLESKMWPSALRSKDVSDVNKYNSFLSTKSDWDVCKFVSDVANLKPTEFEKRTLKNNYLFPDAKIIAHYDVVDEIEVPVLPGINELYRRVYYSGCKSTGTMDVVGSGSFTHKVDKLWINERFYVAKHVNSMFMTDYDGENDDDDDDDDGTTGTLPCDSGACVITGDDEIHSFVIGRIVGADGFRLLSPVHYILKQISKLTRKKNVKFVKYVKKVSTPKDDVKVENELREKKTKSHENKRC